MARPSTILPALVVPILGLVLSCSDLGVPPPPSGPDTTSHSFVWKIDSLGDATYGSWLGGIWGSSPQDVYLVTSGFGLFTGKIWHWNGVLWADITPVYIEAFPGQTIYDFAPHYVYGFGGDDVWIVGERDTSSTYQFPREGFVLHFDGRHWHGMKPPNALNLIAVGGSSSSDLSVGTLFGHIHHFDGNGWQEYALGDTIILESFPGVLNGKVIAWGFCHSNLTFTDYQMLYEWDGQAWMATETAIDRGLGTPFAGPLRVIDGSLYSVPAQSVSRRISVGKWETIFTDLNADFWDIGGDASNNIFAVGHFGHSLVYHFNGYSWHPYPELEDPDADFGRLWVGGGEVFVVGSKNSRIQIAHGVRK
jgi:hypothetical protein